jgi:hypothetical protein
VLLFCDFEIKLLHVFGYLKLEIVNNCFLCQHLMLLCTFFFCNFMKSPFLSIERDVIFDIIAYY